MNDVVKLSDALAYPCVEVECFLFIVKSGLFQMGVSFDGVRGALVMW